MKALLLTNEYPPNIYGGAGVHVDYLSRELAKLMEVEVRCFGSQDVAEDHLRVRGFGLDSDGWTAPKNLHSIFGAVRRCTDFNTMAIDADVVHCHTWYTHLGGIFAKLNYGIPLVITTHSLEPLRPWKREQLGGGYDFSCWVERTAMQMADAVIAVSRESRNDVQRLFNIPPERIPIIYNGIDTGEYKPIAADDALRTYGIDPAVPFILFVGRIARQKGIIHLANAIQYMNPGFQVVLCAGAPDTPEIATEMKSAVAAAQARRPGVIWIQEMVNKAAVFQLYSHAAVFCCPSIYEPFGIINLEAMACETPVVASAVGGIKEVVVDGETGFLVPLEQLKESPFEPVNPDRFARDLAAKINLLMADPALRERMGKAGRRRAQELFSWNAIAAQTKALYESLK
ncbi:MAG TPA: glycogen synthase [Chthoniobacteraceae bacterium]|jgi:glycogen synthase|nr:glycogen synthase [Chthoniobacteraceae bacterium]